jgi:ParB-like chromosome segregation protein Spo0J
VAEHAEAIRALGNASLPLHPITGDYADLTDAEANAMRESLKANGLAVPIAVWRGQVVDGRHRAKFCQELGIEPRYDDISDRCTTEESMRKYVAALNEHRRARTMPLSTAEKQARIKAELKADPERSDRAIAAAVGVSPTTVGTARAAGEVKGDVSKLDTRIDKTGRKQPAKKSKQKQSVRNPKPAPAASKRTSSASAPTPKPTTHHDLRNCWDRAPPDERRRFVDGVSLTVLFEAAPIANQDAFRKRLMS